LTHTKLPPNKLPQKTTLLNLEGGNMIIKKQRSDTEKIEIFSNRFIARTDVHGTYDPKTGKGYQKKEPVTKQVIMSHLMGKQPYGMYMLKEDKTPVLIIDFDEHDINPPIEFIHQAKHYGIPAYLETSKSKGWHVWIFFEKNREKDGVSAIKARTMAHQILKDIGYPNTEIFPKQNSIKNDGKHYGNFINCPLFGKLVPQGKTVFVNPDNNFSPYEQWSFLKNIKLSTEKDLDELIEINEWKLSIQTENNFSEIITDKLKPRDKFLALLPCAQQMLLGVERYQRLTTFRLSIHLKNIGFPYEITISLLKIWAKNNRPTNGKRIISDKEIISQIQYGYKKKYSSYGCGEPETLPFCTKDCRLFDKYMHTKHL
jgi:hypothetical protein